MSPTLSATRYADLSALISRIAYPDHHFILGAMGDGHYLQVRFTAPDNMTGLAAETSWQGRKWYLSPYATDSEVVFTALKAILTALEHEAREKFRFDGIHIFNPHTSLDGLLTAATLPLARRPPAATS